MTCGRGSRHGSVYASTIKPIIDKRCMQCHDGCNPNIPNLSGFDNLATLVPDLHIQRLIAKGLLEARQACKVAPRVIKTDALAKAQLSWRCPVPHDPNQSVLEF